MRQGQDPQHEEIHGQQEVDVLLGEDLRKKYKKKQVRVARSMVPVCPLGVRSGRKNLRLFHFHSWGERPQVPPRWTLLTTESRCLHVIPTFGEGQLLCVPRVLHENPKGIREESEIKPKSSFRSKNLLFNVSFSLLKNPGAL